MGALLCRGCGCASFFVWTVLLVSLAGVSTRGAGCWRLEMGAVASHFDCSFPKAGGSSAAMAWASAAIQGTLRDCNFSDAGSCFVLGSSEEQLRERLGWIFVSITHVVGLSAGDGQSDKHSNRSGSSQ